MRAAAETSTGYAPAESLADPRAVVLARMADYAELTKPRIALFALVTVAAGFALGGAGRFELAGLLHALIGIALVAAGSSAVNQFLERLTDAKMERTAARPLPARRISPAEALAFGLICGVAGAWYLALFVNFLTAALAVITFVLYAFVYTLLKPMTSLNTAAGAIPGALPPVLGWTAAGGSLDLGAFCLFAVLYLWQFPHFMAIAWLYREDYRRAGLKMIPTTFNHGRVAGFIAVAYAMVLIPVSLLPGRIGLAGDVYTVIAAMAGMLYLWMSVRFLLSVSQPAARRLLRISLVYLPVILLSMVGEYFWLLS